MDRLKQYGYVSALQSIFWNSAPVTVSIATFGAYTGMGNTLSMKVRFNKPDSGTHKTVKARFWHA